MSWRNQSAFVTNEPTTDTSLSVPKPKAKKGVFKTVETEVLNTNAITNNYLIIDSKDVIITSDRLHINSKNNSFQIPKTGPININNTMLIDTSSTTIDGELEVTQKMRSSMHMYLVKRVIVAERVIFDKEDYNKCNHYIIDTNSKNNHNYLYLLPFNSYNDDDYPADCTHAYIIHFCVNAKKSDNVDIRVIIEDQDMIIKMSSRFSSLSLLWSPSGQWLIHSLGYKTIPLNE